MQNIFCDSPNNIKQFDNIIIVNIFLTARTGGKKGIKIYKIIKSKYCNIKLQGVRE